jgi:hypothetical protein
MSRNPLDLLQSYTDPKEVTEVAATDTPRNPYRSGYGPKVPTRYQIKYAGRWRRVYMMQYGNAGSAYIMVDKTERFLDLDTEQKLEKLSK